MNPDASHSVVGRGNADCAAHAQTAHAGSIGSAGPPRACARAGPSARNPQRNKSALDHSDCKSAPEYDTAHTQRSVPSIPSAPYVTPIRYRQGHGLREILSPHPRTARCGARHRCELGGLGRCRACSSWQRPFYLIPTRPVRCADGICCPQRSAYPSVLPTHIERALRLSPPDLRGFAPPFTPRCSRCPTSLNVPGQTGRGTRCPKISLAVAIC